MKTILIFIGLKIAEILGVCGVAGILYCFYLGLDLIGTSKIFIYSVAGIIGAVVVAMSLLWLYAIGYGIYLSIKANWKWACKLSKKQ